MFFASLGYLFALFAVFQMLERVSDQAKNLCEDAVFVSRNLIRFYVDKYEYPQVNQHVLRNLLLREIGGTAYLEEIFI